MHQIPKIFVINPGSTSTKIAFFHGTKCVFETSKEHSREELAALGGIIHQLACREEAIKQELADRGIPLDSVDVFISRGGLMHPLTGGIYIINQNMLDDLASFKYGEHASNLGAMIIYKIASEEKKLSYIANPPVVDELSPVARLSGHPDITRRSVFHALNQKAVAEKAANKLGKRYEKCNFVIAHIGGGVSVGVHNQGQVVDVNNGLEGDGPFSPERTGGLPVLDFYRYAHGKQMSLKEITGMVTRNGGLFAHLGTNNCKQIEDEIRSGNKKYQLVYDAFIYQIAKSIGAGAAALSGKVNAVVLTGNVLRGKYFRNNIKKMVSFIGPVFIFAENSEMEALGKSAHDIFTGAKQPKDYNF